MKNQYTCDIGDYGKLGLLRYLADAGFKIGVNWYLTPNEVGQNNDGKFINYLKDKSFRSCDPQLWDSLGILVDANKREVRHLQKAEILPAEFYSVCMDFSSHTYLERKDERFQWHQKALDVLHDCNIIFVDPDNGLMVPSAIKRRKSIKYVLPQELQEYYAAGASIIYYQHKARCKDFVYTKRNTQLVESGAFPSASGFGLKFHTTSQRFYFFILQPQHEVLIRTQIRAMLETPWGKHFSLCE